MSDEEANKASVRRYFDEVYVHGKVEFVRELFVPAHCSLEPTRATPARCSTCTRTFRAGDPGREAAPVGWGHGGEVVVHGCQRWLIDSSREPPNRH
jgi:hypothetical protein